MIEYAESPNTEGEIGRALPTYEFGTLTNESEFEKYEISELDCYVIKTERFDYSGFFGLFGKLFE